MARSEVRPTVRHISSWLIVGLLLALGAGRAFAVEDSIHTAKVLFFEGKKEYEHQRYEVAYHLFERAYQASYRPALLFNMAACLQALDRPREAAAKLREYLDRVPNESQRAAIEDSIGELKERAIEQEAAVHAEHEASSPPRVANDSQRALLEERIRALEAKLDVAPPAPSRRNLVIGLSVAAGVIVVAGVAITLGLVLDHGASYTPSSFGGGPLQSTR